VIAARQRLCRADGNIPDIKEAHLSHHAGAVEGDLRTNARR